MKKCWNENPLKRPSVSVVKNIIGAWIFPDYESNNETSDNETSNNETSDNESSEEFSDYKISKKLKSNIMEFINAPIGNNKRITEFHPQACYTSRSFNFTSRKVNEILESGCLDYIVVDDKSSKKLVEIVESECLDDCIVDNIKSFEIGTNKN
ncbi:kinase-like domain-containing protein [Rhizophagus clarus]|uniref:Kinase-like domain-containing protein n=1 Tax=Rhizophagus clarus TaxID=94130 RepID=A0A8H3KZL1_9GLOM|nr:kinase-like domain-containing protein [Rhizophagus clarus]